MKAPILFCLLYTIINTIVIFMIDQNQGDYIMKRAQYGYSKDVGKIIWARGKQGKGVITNLIDRYCAGCGCCGTTYSVKWDDGGHTYPCPAGCKYNADGTVEIL